MGQHRWSIALATGVGVASFLATGSVIALANHFVEELSSPHTHTTKQPFSFQLPSGAPEPPLSMRRPITFHTVDGKILRGDFWAQPHAAPTVVLCHGYRFSRDLLRPVAALEYLHGFNVLLFDFRGHGESQRVNTSGGSAEVRDLEAALDVAALQQETLPGKIVVHGFSMGAAIALLMQPRPEVAAIVADSPYAHLDEILRRLIHFELSHKTSRWRTPFSYLHRIFPAVSWMIVGASQAVFFARFRHRLIVSPAASLRRWSMHKYRVATTGCPYPPILLIHGLADQAIPFEHACRLVAQARSQNIPLTTYFVAQADHCGAYGFDPAGYIQELKRFLASCLGSLA